MRQPVIFRGTLRNKHSKRQKNSVKEKSSVSQKENDVEIEVNTEPEFPEYDVLTFTDDSRKMDESDKPKVELSELLKADCDLKKLCDDLLK
ncbi:MAG: hypothetical protein PHI78_02580 [Clostridia bacterium]|nr:hypothetical protein [Clostridia bacterium]